MTANADDAPIDANEAALASILLNAETDVDEIEALLADTNIDAIEEAEATALIASYELIGPTPQCRSGSIEVLN